MSDSRAENSEDSTGAVLVRGVERIISEEAADALTVDTQRLHVVWNAALNMAVHSSPLQQFGIGFGIGWISGYLFRRVSRTAAFVVGFSFIAVQGATSLGIISVNWNRMRLLAQMNLRRVEGHVAAVRRASGIEEGGSLTEQILALASHHMYLSSGFASGAVAAITF